MRFGVHAPSGMIGAGMINQRGGAFFVSLMMVVR
jgi:hypothetical protein